jgi:hypothetical protein
MEKYRDTLEYAMEVRHMPLIVPAYFRLVELLARQGETTKALHFIEQFEKRYKGKIPKPYAPTESQVGLMMIKKSQLKNAARSTVPTPTT